MYKQACISTKYKASETVTLPSRRRLALPRPAPRKGGVVVVAAAGAVTRKGERRDEGVWAGTWWPGPAGGGMSAFHCAREVEYSEDSSRKKQM